MLSPQNLKVKFSTISALGTYLVLYTSLLPFSNNILEVFFPEIKTTYIQVADANASTVIWCFGMCLQSAIIIMVSFMKPYLLSYAFPMFTSLYSASFYGLYLIGHRPNENFWFFFYIILFIALILSFMHTIRLYLKVQKMKENAYLKSMKKRLAKN